MRALRSLLFFVCPYRGQHSVRFLTTCFTIRAGRARNKKRGLIECLRDYPLTMKIRSNTTPILYLLAGLLCGCAPFPEAPASHSKPAENIYDPKFPVYNPSAHVKNGDMAYVVEKRAKAGGCELSENASLMATRPGIQFYRVPCGDGRSILYKCELRQCRMAD